jgi:hypothetical protein
MAPGFERFRNGIGLVVAVALALPMFDPAIAWFMVPAAIGGLMMAGTLFLIHRTNRLEHLEDATDAPDGLKLGMFNLSSVNPSGIGGLGLSVIAVIAALNYREGQYLLIAGLTGGLVIAATMIHYRRTHDTTQDRLPLHLTNGRSGRR